MCNTISTLENVNIYDRKKSTFEGQKKITSIKGRQPRPHLESKTPESRGKPDWNIFFGSSDWMCSRMAKNWKWKENLCFGAKIQMFFIVHTLWKIPTFSGSFNQIVRMESTNK